jgi:hypothetical protein
MPRHVSGPPPGTSEVDIGRTSSKAELSVYPKEHEIS